MLEMWGNGCIYLNFRKRSRRASQCAPERAVHEAMRMKSKAQWSAQEVRESKNKEYLLRKVKGSEQIHNKREVMRAATSNAIGARPCKNFVEFISCYNLPQMLQKNKKTSPFLF